jgi:tryptophanyl-tRNA synthetase
MTTWKSRLAASKNQGDDSEMDETALNVGLFAYPVLQAADILLYKCVAFVSFWNVWSDDIGQPTSQ